MVLIVTGRQKRDLLICSVSQLRGHILGFGTFGKHPRKYWVSVEGLSNSELGEAMERLRSHSDPPISQEWVLADYPLSQSAAPFEGRSIPDWTSADDCQTEEEMVNG